MPSYYKELAAFKTILHSVTIVIVLFLLQTLVYIKYCNLIGFETIAQVPYAMVHFGKGVAVPDY